jgi:molybdopterin-guanine dinucleotide biosynthesis protein A
MKLSAAILAGGTSSRMGRDKAFLELDGRPLVLHVVDRLSVFDVFIVAKETAPFDGFGVAAVADANEASTPLTGVLTALRASTLDRVFVCACDMPFVSPDVVRLLASRLEDRQAVVPRHGGRAEPLHAVWSTRAAAHVEDALRAGERSVHRVLDGLRVTWVEEEEWMPLDPDGLSFVNINTPADHSEAAARTAAARSSSSAPFPTASPSA